MVRHRVAVTLICLLAALNMQGAVLASNTSNALLNLSIDELMDIEVTSAAKKKQKLSDVAAAIDVITRDDILRSGMNSVPELLRMATGLNVARLSANSWAISARGFNNICANKLLVMIDGRSLYTSTFGGVFWDLQDLVLDDIDRIEVIRGPGGTLWGANAVNGVINIITRHSRDTQGAYVAAVAGDPLEGLGTFRYGGQLADEMWYRVYGKAFRYDDFEDGAGLPARDAWDAIQGGFRLDWQPTSEDNFYLSASYYQSEADRWATDILTVAPFSSVMEGQQDSDAHHILGRWNRKLADNNEFQLRLYYDYVERCRGDNCRRYKVYDLDFQHRYYLNSVHELTWGAGYRINQDDLDSSFSVSFLPEKEELQVASVFLQDEIELNPGLYLTLGAKVEDNDITGVEAQPSARLLWQPDADHSFWAAVSRAVRTPARFERNSVLHVTAFEGGPDTTGVVRISGNPDIKAEELLAWELGYRGRLDDNLSFDVATFLNQYDCLRMLSSGTPFIEMMPDRLMVVPSSYDNQASADAYGVEASIIWQALPNWQLKTSYTWVKFDLDLSMMVPGASVSSINGDFPEHQFQLHSRYDLSDRWQFDSSLYHVARQANGSAPAYTRLDLRLGWQPSDSFEASLSLQNVLDDKHPEFNTVTNGSRSNEVPRSVALKLAWRW